MLLVLIYLLSAVAADAYPYVPPWMTLPPAPGLPKTTTTGYVNATNGVNIWYAQFGPSLSETTSNGMTPILFIHGAQASSDYWGHQISYLLHQEEPSTIIAMDLRLMGRSTYGDLSTSFSLKAADTIAVLDHLGIDKAAVVGWSNGAVTLVNLLLDYHSRIERAFVFAAGYDADTSLNRTTGTAQFNATSAVYFERTLEELVELSVDPELVPAARQAYTEEYVREPHWTADDFARIPMPYEDCEAAPLVWFVEGAEEEIVNKGAARTMHEWTPGSGWMVLPDVSHFA